MVMENNLTERVLRFQEEIIQRGALRTGADLGKVQHSQRAYQLTQNFLVAILAMPIDLKLLKTFRDNIDALAEMDLTDHRAYKQPQDLPLIEQSYQDERELFRQHFPQDEFLSLYESG